jgi:hypothetical protein
MDQPYNAGYIAFPAVSAYAGYYQRQKSHAAQYQFKSKILPEQG